MDEVLEIISCEKENEEGEDYESFFLKPASSPYNIAEKVHQANLDLFGVNEDTKEVAVAERRETKVKFREQVVTFEPELTDDDVVSIESDHTDTTSNDSNLTPQVLEYKKNQPCWSALDVEQGQKVESVNLQDIYSIIEEDGDDISEDIEEDSLDEEEHPQEQDNNDNNEPPEGKMHFDQETFYQTEKENDTYRTTKVIQAKTIDISQEINITDSSRTITPKKKKVKRRKLNKNNYQASPTNPGCIECKSHCIEKLESDLSMSIRRLELQEKPGLPPLKLYERKCCRSSKQQHLPCYDGFRSEYGLSLPQLERRERTKQVVRMQRQQRRELLEEYRERRNKQNEEVFREWLQEVSKRKEDRQKSGGGDKHNVNVSQRQRRPRPKTSSCVVSKGYRKNRPNRPSTSHLYVEVPEAMFIDGINLDDLFYGTPLSSKRMQIFTMNKNIKS